MKVTLLILSLVAAGLLGSFFYQRRMATRERELQVEREVKAVHPVLRQMQSQVNATGAIRLATGAEVRVGAQISGIVSKLNVSVGSHVAKDDVIAIIDSRGLQARIEDARQQVAVDETALHKLQRDAERTRALLNEGLIPRQQAEDLEEDLQNALARVAKSRSSLDVVQSDLPYLEIHAPIAGTVASVSTLQGETVAASFAAPTFVTIIADNALELAAMVDETDIGAVRPGQKVTFTTETFPGRDFRGVVERIAPKATIVSGVVNYEVDVAIRGSASDLKPDMTTNVIIETASRQALMVPHAAIRHEGDADFVLLKSSKGPERHSVVIGNREGVFDEIRGGLTVESWVLVQP